MVLDGQFSLLGLIVVHVLFSFIAPLALFFPDWVLGFPLRFHFFPGTLLQLARPGPDLVCTDFTGFLVQIAHLNVLAALYYLLVNQLLVVPFVVRHRFDLEVEVERPFLSRLVLLQDSVDSGVALKAVENWLNGVFVQVFLHK